MTITERAVARRKTEPSQRKATSARADDLIHRPTRAPAKQRENGWGLYAWLAWQDRLFPGLNSTQRQPLVCEICGIREAMYYKLNSGTQFPSERVQKLCELAELAARVAEGHDTESDKRTAKRLLEGREADLMQVAHHVLKGTVKETIRRQAAKAVLLGETKIAQSMSKDIRPDNDL